MTRWTTRFVRRLPSKGVGLNTSTTLMQEAVKAFHRPNARSTFDKILKGLSRWDVANEIMEQVAGTGGKGWFTEPANCE